MDICLGGSGLLLSLPVLLADLDDLLGAIVPVIFVIIWVISQVMGALGGAKKRRLAEENEEQLEETSTDLAPPQDLANEIQKFLHRAQQQATQQRQAAEQQAVEVVPAELAEAEPAEIVVADPLVPTRKRSRAATREHRPLPDTLVDDSPLLPEEQQEPVFDHRIINLPESSIPVDQEQQPEIAVEDGPEIPTTASEIHSLLADAQSARKAFVLSEIFSRPEDRW